MRVLPVLLALAGLAIPVAAAPASMPTARYAVEAGDGARELRVEATFSEGPSGGDLVFEDGMGRFVREAQVASGRNWTAAAVEQDTLRTTACRRGCRVRYVFLLEEATRGARNRDSAFAQGGALVAAPSVWLIRPAARGPGRYHLQVTTPAGFSFATGIFPAGPGAYEANLADLPEAPYSAFGPFETAHIRVTGGEVEVAVLPGATVLDRAALLAWVERAAGDVASYYGRFPLPRALVILIPGGRRAVGFGTTMGNGGGSIMIWVGAAASETDLRRDWVLTHEMVHLGLPNLPRAQHWMEEGLATYVEPIARARHGHLSVEEVWTDLVRRTPQGVPGAGGLDANRGFQAIYWGGALFWLLADVEIRERTDNRKSLEDALRGIRDAGGSIAVTWPVERTLAVADRAVGVEVLGPLYERLAAQSAQKVDLAALWGRLGLEDVGGIRFRDDAPLGRIRRAITEPAAAVSRGAR